MNTNLDRLKDSISSCLAAEKAYDLPSVCERYSLDPGEEDEAYRSKFKYVFNRIKGKKEQFIVDLSKKLIDDYQSYQLGSSLNKFLDNKFYTITELTRRTIVEGLQQLGNISGKLSSDEFLLKVGLSNIIDFDVFDLFGITEKKDSLQELIDSNVLYDLLDSQFIIFVEQIVHPITRNEIEIETYLKSINAALERDNYKLIQVDHVSGRPIYKAIRDFGVEGNIKNLIFASTGYKPEIVLKDALNNTIQIVKNKDSCLVYDKEIKVEGLKWVELVEWWSNLRKKERNAQSAKELFDRLNRSLDSKPEKDLLRTYYYHYGEILGAKLPALIPQVYLHYDPYTIRKHGIKYLLRQRMDFLILFSSSKRVVIEIDGKHHYSIGDTSSPKIYSEMVKLDRELKFLNYDVYRLGGFEMTNNMKEVTITFFDNLFEKYL